MESVLRMPLLVVVIRKTVAVILIMAVGQIGHAHATARIVPMRAFVNVREIQGIVRVIQTMAVGQIQRVLVTFKHARVIHFQHVLPMLLGVHQTHLVLVIQNARLM